MWYAVVDVTTVVCVVATRDELMSGGLERRGTGIFVEMKRKRSAISVVITTFLRDNCDC